MLLLSVLILMSLAATEAFIFSSACLPSPTYPTVCCPLYFDSPCGYKYNRGRCVQLVQSRTVPPINIFIDSRHKFPITFYSHICECYGKYGGANCGGCKFNHDGPNCDPVNVLRREIRQLHLTELTTYLAKINYCKKTIDPDYVILRATDRYRIQSYEFFKGSYYDVWCFGHYYATKPFINNTRENWITNYAHGGPGFLTWHRYNLLCLEQAMQRCLRDPHFGLIYYDWRRDPDCAICNEYMLGSNNAEGMLNPFSIFSTWRVLCGGYDYDRSYCLTSDNVCEWPTITRRVGRLGTRKPNKADVDYCLSLRYMDTPPYDRRSTQSFRNCLEGWRDSLERAATSVHNLWHVYCSGTMSQVPIACSDFMFVLHHTFIDKCFEQYIIRNNCNPSCYPRNDIYGHRPTDCITPSHYCFTHESMVVPLSTFNAHYSVYYD